MVPTTQYEIFVFMLLLLNEYFSCSFLWSQNTIKLKTAKVTCQIKHTLSTFMQKKVFHVSYEYEEYILTVLWDRNGNLWKG